jgi:hypothetical protein
MTKEEKEAFIKALSEEETIMLITDLAANLGWGIVLTGENEEDVNGLIIGTEDYIANLYSYFGRSAS